MLVTIIGRGHSGTRAISRTLAESDVFMGAERNASDDLVPAETMYRACRILARHVRYLGNLEWDFSALQAMPVDPEFERRVREYLQSVLDHPGPARGWKLPETTLAYPWIARMFPDAHYIHWVRDPRDNILGAHLTDDLTRFGIPFDDSGDDPARKRAVSWKYQAAIYRATPPPKHLLELRFEDFVLDQDATLRKVEDFLGRPLVRIPVDPGSVGRWRRADPALFSFDFLSEEMKRYGYGPTPSFERTRETGPLS